MLVTASCTCHADRKKCAFCNKPCTLLPSYGIRQMKPREGKHSRSTEFNEKKFNSRMHTAYLNRNRPTQLYFSTGKKHQAKHVFNDRPEGIPVAAKLFTHRSLKWNLVVDYKRYKSHPWWPSASYYYHI